MKCPKCGKDKGSRVIDTRGCADGIARKRVCFSCHIVYTTTESIDEKQKALKKQGVQT